MTNMTFYLKSYGDKKNNGFYTHITPPASEMESFVKWVETLEETQSGYVNNEFVTHYFVTNEPCLLEIVVVEQEN